MHIDTYVCVCVCAVSYTHLDVYKRQSQDRSNACCIDPAE